MVFSSLEFIFIFLPIFFLIYYLVPKKMRNGVLFGGSLLFYYLGSSKAPAYFLLFVISLAFNYAIAICIDNRNNRKHYSRSARGWLILGVALNLAMLALFKYSADIFYGLNALLGQSFLGLELPLSGWVLPLGISFYVFRAIAYLVDVYRKQLHADKSFIRFGAFFAAFPHLTAGPIVRYRDMARQLRRHELSLDCVLDGVRTFIIGLGMKALISDNIYGIWSQVCTLGLDGISTPLAWLSIIGYSIYIFFDFAGYSLMAIGLGKMMGFSLPQNFNAPYLSITMTEFWRRWHITLGSFYRDYVYIPLGGSRVSKPRLVLNTLAVWVLTGIWHGSTLNFLLWGLFLFAVIIAEKFLYGWFMEKHRPLGHIYMLLLIPISWSFFAISDAKELVAFWGQLFPFFGGASIPATDFVDVGLGFLPYILAGIVLCLPFVPRIYEKIKKIPLLGDVLLCLILAASIYFISKGLGNPFLYGGF
ncbi:MAG: MBOAT family protein [Clostridia bacterium]|nr:MBOAT family protein [Clostridia bacterium]